MKCRDFCLHRTMAYSTKAVSVHICKKERNIEEKKTIFLTSRVNTCFKWLFVDPENIAYRIPLFFYTNLWSLHTYCYSLCLSLLMVDSEKIQPIQKKILGKNILRLPRLETQCIIRKLSVLKFLSLIQNQLLIDERCQTRRKFMHYIRISKTSGVLKDVSQPIGQRRGQWFCWHQ